MSARQEKVRGMRREWKTYKEIGEEMGVSRQRAHQIGNKIKKIPLLSARHEAYSVNILKGMKPLEAGRAAGFADSTSKWLKKHPGVRARILELRNMVVKEAVAEVEERRAMLTEIIRKELPTKGHARDRVAAIAELNKLDGSYPPEKHAILGKVIIEIERKDRVSLIGGH